MWRGFARRCAKLAGAAKFDVLETPVENPSTDSMEAAMAASAMVEAMHRPTILLELDREDADDDMILNNCLKVLTVGNSRFEKYQ